MKTQAVVICLMVARFLYYSTIVRQNPLHLKIDLGYSLRIEFKTRTHIHTRASSCLFMSFKFLQFICIYLFNRGNMLADETPPERLCREKNTLNEAVDVGV